MNILQLENVTALAAQQKEMWTQYRDALSARSVPGDGLLLALGIGADDVAHDRTAVETIAALDARIEAAETDHKRIAATLSDCASKLRDLGAATLAEAKRDELSDRIDKLNFEDEILERRRARLASIVTRAAAGVQAIRAARRDMQLNAPRLFAELGEWLTDARNPRNLRDAMAGGVQTAFR